MSLTRRASASVATPDDASFAEPRAVDPLPDEPVPDSPPCSSTTLAGGAVRRSRVRVSGTPPKARSCPSPETALAVLPALGVRRSLVKSKPTPTPSGGSCSTRACGEGGAKSSPALASGGARGVSAITTRRLSPPVALEPSEKESLRDDPLAAPPLPTHPATTSDPLEPEPASSGACRGEPFSAASGGCTASAERPASTSDTASTIERAGTGGAPAVTVPPDGAPPADPLKKLFAPASAGAPLPLPP